MRDYSQQNTTMPEKKACAIRVLILLFVCGSTILYPSALVHAVGISPAAVTVYGQASNFTTNASNSGGVSVNSLASLVRTTLDSNGNLYVADRGNNRVLYYPAGSQTATRVYGQAGSFATNTTNNGGVSANTLYQPYGMLLDSSGDLYVADQNNNRVLYYPVGSTTATRVYGQSGSFTSNSSNNGNASANTLNLPTGVALDGSGDLYVADQNNNRVLYYPVGSTTATRVYGQSGSFSTINGSLSANGLSQPSDLALDSSGNLYVADKGNNRVLYYPVGSTTATRVYGQAGSYTTSTANNGGISSMSLSSPAGLILDSSGNLYVADYTNNRVLYYSAGSTTATRVYGQSGSFITGTFNNGGISANSLYQPTGVSLDSANNLIIADNTNNRVLYYPVGSTTATRVIGQSGFTTNSANNGGISSISLSGPAGLALDSSGDLYVADQTNNRVLYYPVGSIVATRVYGQAGSYTTSTANNGGISSISLSGPAGLALDSSGDLYVADQGNNRVLYYPVGSTTATRVIGQSSFFTNSANNGGVTSASLSSPAGLALDSSGDLYVADQGNNRVLYYPVGSATATRVYGQNGSFTANGPNNGGTSANSLANPIGLALDSSGNLYVCDSNNNRVLYYSAGSTTATRVYGQNASFNSGSSGVSTTTFNRPIGVVLDSSGDLWVADYNNSRVVYFATGSTTATRVYGQGGSFTTSNSNNNGLSATSLSQPFALAVDSSGNLYIADFTNNRVLKFQSGLRVTTQPPTSTAAGVTFSTAVSLVDVGSGAIFSDFTGTVSVILNAGSGTSGAVLSGTSSSVAVSGVSTFSNLSINLGGSGYLLTLSSPGVGSVSTNTFVITGGTAATLLFTPLTNPSFTFILTGSSGTITSQHTFKVNDTTQSGVGWHITITSTQFITSGGSVLPTTANTITSVSTACTAGQICVLPTNGVSGYPLTVPAATVAPVALTYFSAAAGTGTGDVTLTTTFLLTVPQGTAAGLYNSVITEALIKGQ